MLPYLWLLATIAQAALLAAYWRAKLHRRFPWWCAALAAGAIGNVVLMCAGPRNRTPYALIWTAHQALMWFLRIVAAREAANGEVSVRAGFWLAAPVAAIAFFAPMATAKWNPLTGIRSAIASISLVLFFIVGMAVRNTPRPFRYPFSPHSGIVMLSFLPEIRQPLVILGLVTPMAGNYIGMGGLTLVCLLGAVALLIRRGR